MIADGCEWWVRRFQNMAKYFDAYRIDHVLGFFRIWAIPTDCVGGLLGQFQPALAMTRDEIIRDGRELAALADNVVVKIPTMVEGLAATKALSEEGIPVNMTLCFSVPQAIMAARAGARYISPFVGRFDDIAEDGISQLADVVAAVNNYDFGHDVEIIAASVRSANHVTQAALMGADIATVPFAALKKCVQHPLTDRGLDAFMKDWEKVQQA